MRPWLSFVVFAFSIGAAMAEDLPPAVQKAIAENKRVCKTVAIEKGFITRKDINRTAGRTSCWTMSRSSVTGTRGSSAAQSDV
jgi:ribosomal protein S5